MSIWPFRFLGLKQGTSFRGYFVSELSSFCVFRWLGGFPTCIAKKLWDPPQSDHWSVNQWRLHVCLSPSDETDQGVQNPSLLVRHCRPSLELPTPQVWRQTSSRTGGRWSVRTHRSWYPYRPWSWPHWEETVVVSWTCVLFRRRTTLCRCCRRRRGTPRYASDTLEKSLFSESGNRNVVVFDGLSSQGQDTVNAVCCIKRKVTLSCNLSDEWYVEVVRFTPEMITVTKKMVNDRQFEWVQSLWSWNFSRYHYLRGQRRFLLWQWPYINTNFVRMDGDGQTGHRPRFFICMWGDRGGTKKLQTTVTRFATLLTTNRDIVVYFQQNKKRRRSRTGKVSH